MKAKKRLDVSGGSGLSQDLFGQLDAAKLPAGSASSAHEDQAANGETSAPDERRPTKKRGRVEIRREKSGRGGKIVTTAKAFQGVCPAEQEEWVKELKRKCGAGGTSRPGAIEIQGDRRDDLVRFFEDKGFRPVLAGG